MTNAIRVLMLNDDNHTPSYHSEDTTHWHDANHFIKWLTRPRTTIIPYEVRQVYIYDLEVNPDEPSIDMDTMFDIVQFNGRGYSFEEYQEAFNALWKVSEEI